MRDQCKTGTRLTVISRDLGEDYSVKTAGHTRDYKHHGEQGIKVK